MLAFLKREANKTLTENGAATYRSTRSDCLDLFAAIGALRGADEKEITDRFLRAYAEDADLAMKLLFYARDVRGGIGERRVFRTIARWLADNRPQSLEKNIPHIAEYGRWDDLLVLLGTPCEASALRLIESQLAADSAALKRGAAVSLLAKWLPSVNASSEETVRQAKHIARALRMSDAEYRRLLSRLRERIRILENSLRERDYTFDYAKQPSKAMFKYRKAFLRNDAERYEGFLQRVSAGEEKLHTGTLLPYEIVRPLLGSGRSVSREEIDAVDATWNAQEDHTGDENALVVVDGSGSMYGGGEPLPASVALSLAIYYAERNIGVFRNHFITFSESPQMVEIKGNDILEKLRYCSSFNEVANTNIQRVFELLLATAVKYRVPQKEMPARLYIISDMEFDYCTRDASLTNFEYARRAFAGRGYRLPQLVFWNVASRNRQQPVQADDSGAILVSGCSARIFSMLNSDAIDPYAYMLSVLRSARYLPIAA